MAAFIIRRLLTAIPLLVGISFVTFFLLFHTPGDFLASLRLDPKISPEFLEAERRRLGLDQHWIIVWARWLWGVVTQGNFGQSFAYKVPASELIGSRLFNTFLLAFTSTVFAWIVAVPLGIAAALRQNKSVDRVASAVAFLGLSIPNVLLALFAIYLAAVTGWFPVGGMRSDQSYLFTSNWEKMKDIARHLVLPTLVLGTSGLAIYTRQMRSNLLETLDQDYVRTAMAKGLPRSRAVLRHAVRNALNPLITLFGFAFSDLLSGAVLVENVMAWPGLGRTVVEAMLTKDLFVVASSVVLASAMLILGNLIADILLMLNDPRIRMERKHD